MLTAVRILGDVAGQLTNTDNGFEPERVRLLYCIYGPRCWLAIIYATRWVSHSRESQIAVEKDIASVANEYTRVCKLQIKTRRSSVIVYAHAKFIFSSQDGGSHEQKHSRLGSWLLRDVLQDAPAELPT